LLLFEEIQIGSMLTKPPIVYLFKEARSLLA